MKNIFNWIVWKKVEIIFILLIIIWIYMVVLWAQGVDNRGKERQKKDTQFINECLKQKDRRVETVGSFWTNTHLVCNPK